MVADPNPNKILTVLNHQCAVSASNQTCSQLPTVKALSFSFSRQDPRLLVSQARVFD